MRDWRTTGGRYSVVDRRSPHTSVDMSSRPPRPSSEAIWGNVLYPLSYLNDIFQRKYSRPFDVKQGCISISTLSKSRILHHRHRTSPQFVHYLHTTPSVILFHNQYINHPSNFNFKMGGSLEAFKAFMASEKRRQEKYDAHMKAKETTAANAGPDAQTPTSMVETNKNEGSSTGTSHAGSPVQKGRD